MECTNDTSRGGDQAQQVILEMPGDQDRRSSVILNKVKVTLNGTKSPDIKGKLFIFTAYIKFFYNPYSC